MIARIFGWITPTNPLKTVVKKNYKIMSVRTFCIIPFCGCYRNDHPSMCLIFVIIMAMKKIVIINN